MALTAGTALAQVEGWSRLDPAVDAYRRVLAPDGPAAVLPDLAQRARQWLGHPSHPAFAQLSAGLLLSAGIADWLPGTGTAVPMLTTAGLLSAVPTALTGAGDWASLSRPHARAGVVHAGLNEAALAAFIASLLARARGKGARGKGWGALGTGLLGASAVIGGHLATVAAAGPSPVGAAASQGVDPASLSDADLAREIDHLYRTRGDTLRAGSTNALAAHTERMAVLEGEYLRRSTEEGGARMTDALPDPLPAAAAETGTTAAAHRGPETTAEASVPTSGEASEPPAEPPADLSPTTGDAARVAGGAPPDLSGAHEAGGAR